MAARVSPAGVQALAPKLTSVMVAVPLRQQPVQESGVGAAHGWHVEQHHPGVEREGIRPFPTALKHGWEGIIKGDDMA